MSDKYNLEFEPGTEAGELDEDAVLENEEMIGLDFPPDYLDFLREHNGGVPKKKYFKMEDNTKVLEFFLCMVADVEDDEFGDSDVGVVWSEIEDRLNEWLVPFAAVFAGDFACFDYEKNAETPSVVLWNHDLSDTRKPVTFPIADNFQQFLSMLTDDENA